MLRPVTYLVLATVFGLASLSAGCASSERTAKTEQTTTYETPPPAAPASNVEPQTGETKTVQTQTETKTEAAAPPAGIIGTTWHLLGEILAFPFLLVGNALKLIF